MSNTSSNPETTTTVLLKIFGLSSAVAVMGAFGAAFISLFGFVVWAPLAFLRAWVAVKLWTWFMIPAGFQQVSMYTFVGIMLVISALGLYMPNKQPQTIDENIKASKASQALGPLITLYFAPLFSLLFGYVVKTWIM